MQTFSQTIFSICILVHLTNGQLSNPCLFKAETTWSTAGELIAIDRIDSAVKCLKLCLEEENCQGFTWHGQTKLQNFCILFEVIRAYLI